MILNLKILKSIPFQLISIIILVVLFGNLLPQVVLSGFYTISEILKSLLVFTLPLLIITSLLVSFTSLQGKKAIVLIFSILIIVCISNYISTLVAYGVASLEIININVIQHLNVNDLKPLLDITFPALIPSHYSLFIGVTLFANCN